MKNMLIEKENEIVSKILDVSLSEWNFDSFTLNYKGYEIGFEEVFGILSTPRMYLYLVKNGMDKVLIANTMVDSLFGKVYDYAKQERDEKRLLLICEINRDIRLD